MNYLENVPEGQREQVTRAVETLSEQARTAHQVGLEAAATAVSAEQDKGPVPPAVIARVAVEAYEQAVAENFANGGVIPTQTVRI